MESERGLRVVFPTIVILDASGGPQVQPVLEFESPLTREKWEQRILETFRGQRGQASETAAPGAAKAPAAAEERPPRPRPPMPPPPPPLPPVKTAVAFVAGGTLGNPGPAAAAALVCLPGREPIELMRYLGDAAAGVAEFTAVRVALQEVERLSGTGLAIPELIVRGDSSLAIKQFQGQWRVREPELAQIARECESVVERLGIAVRYEQLGREANGAAVSLVNRCLDASAPER